jgi:threonine dehydratase
MYNRMRGASLPCAGDTLAEGIAVKEPGGITARMVQALVDDIVLVSERRLEEAVALLLQIEKTVVEGAGAAGLAALLAYPERFRGKTVGVVLCGGNIDTRLLANVLLRDLARSGRLARLRIRYRTCRARSIRWRASSIRNASTSSRSITSGSSPPCRQKA